MADIMEMKVSAKKPANFYIRSAQSFFKGVDAKPAADGKEAVEAKPPVEMLKISGLGDAIGLAVTAATRTEAEKIARITNIETQYPEMANGRGCAQITITMRRHLKRDRTATFSRLLQEEEEAAGTERRTTRLVTRGSCTYANGRRSIMLAMDMPQDTLVEEAQLDFEKLVEDLYKTADKNKDGKISSAEAAVTLGSSDILKEIWDLEGRENIDSMVQSIFTESNKLSMDEFKEKMLELEEKVDAAKVNKVIDKHRSKVDELFQKHDENGDGLIDLAELKKAFKDVRPEANDKRIAKWAAKAFRQHEELDRYSFGLLCLAGPLSEHLK